MLAGVVEVEVPYHGYVIGIRRPHGEISTRDPFHLDQVATHFLVEPEVRAFVEQKQVVFGQQTEVGQVSSRGLRDGLS